MSYLGDLGGCLGLCLGASIVTILEAIEFCLDAMSRRLSGKTVDRKIKPANNIS